MMRITLFQLARRTKPRPHQDPPKISNVESIGLFGLVFGPAVGMMWTRAQPNKTEESRSQAPR